MRTIERKQPASDSVRPDAILGLKRNELSPAVRSYADNLVTQIQHILSPHNIKSIEEFERIAKQTEKFPYKELEELQKLVNLLKQAVESNKIPETETTLSEARDIMGEQDFIGPDALKTIYGGVEIKDVPQIPFSTQELREANERGEFLILRLDTLPNGKPTTMQNLHEYFSDFNLLASPSDDWKLKSDFFTKETPNVSWALVSKEVIPNSTSKNYYEQTVGLRDHLKSEVYKVGMPRKYEEAIQEFEAWISATFPGKSTAQIKAELQDNNKWNQYAEQLANLKINQLCRQNAVEALFDMIVYYKRNGERLLPDMYTWTKSRDSDGRLVGVGDFGAGGADVSGWSPDRAGGYLGVLLSRRG